MDWDKNGKSDRIIPSHFHSPNADWTCASISSSSSDSISSNPSAKNSLISSELILLLIIRRRLIPDRALFHRHSRAIRKFLPQDEEITVSHFLEKNQIHNRQKIMVFLKCKLLKCTLQNVQRLFYKNFIVAFEITLWKFEAFLFSYVRF